VACIDDCKDLKGKVFSYGYELLMMNKKDVLEQSARCGGFQFNDQDSNTQKDLENNFIYKDHFRVDVHDSKTKHQF